ncbi:secreted seminal-vesicle Ly-6 protein 1-like, partial [Chelydra serpentina]
SCRAAGALLCHVCVSKEPVRLCQGWDTCKANPGESCYIHTVQRRRTFFFEKMGCISNCKNYILGPYTWHIFRCCTRDFCNA